MKTNLLFAVLLGLACVRCEAASFDQGRRLVDEKNYPEAVQKLELEAHANPGSAEVLLNLGWAYWHAKRIDDAYRVGSTLVKLNPENRSFLIFLANTDIEKKRYHAAHLLADQALKLAPGDHDASMVLARALFFEGRAKEALPIIDKIIKAAPGDSGAVYRRAEFLSELGRKTEALASLDALLESDPKNAAYRRTRARVLSQIGRRNEAKQEWTDLTRDQPDTQSLMNLGWAYWREKNYDEAWRIASTLVKLDGNNPAFLRFMANLEIERMHYPHALRLSQKAENLAPGDRDAELMLAKALFRVQREKEAMAILKKLIVQYPDNAAVEYRWAEFLTRTGRPAESLDYFDRLIKDDPENETYRLNRGMALYELGSFDAALSDWRLLASRSGPNMAAVRLLRDDSFNRKDWDGAVAWQKRVLESNPTDPLGWEKLSKIYSAMKRLPEALAAAQSAITNDPVSINAYYMKGDLLLQMNNPTAAMAAYEDALAHNPNSARALDGMSYALEAQGRYADALKAVRRIETLTAPSISPFLQLHKARLLTASQDYAKAYKIIRQLEAAGRTPIPVLLYHGISPFDRSDSIPADALRSQLAALKAKGYQAITASELDRVFQGKARLPEKPLLITFDDGRTDTFENADPILKELGLRATMFVHVSKLRKTHFHASAEDVARWQATGRWDMQAHGDQAHDPMPIDGFGRQGHFLANRKWLADINRLETLAEYRSRLGDEYDKARQGVEDMAAGHQIVAFAYPYGDYGQNDYSNTPESAAINQTLIRGTFHLAFVQDSYGMNTVSSNPTDLRRYEVPRYMTARQLTSQLALSDPRAQAQLLEAQLWTRADQLGRAQAVYADLAAAGVDEPRVWADEGVAFQRGGDISYAQNLFARAAAQEPDKESSSLDQDKKLLAQAAHAAAPVVSAEAQAFNDSDSNEITKELLRGGAVIKSVRLGAWVGHGYYLDRLNPPGNPPHIQSEEGGLQLHWFADPKLDLDGFYARRAFSKGEGFSDNYSVAASYQLLPSLKLAARDGLGNVETAAAIRNGRKSHSDGADAVWDPALNWRTSADYADNRFNDSNWEQDIRVRITKRFSDRLAFGAAYFNGDSKRREADYYTPVGLNQYTALITVNQTLGALNARTGLAPAQAELQYEGGYGVQPAGSRMVNSVKAVFTLRPWDRVALSVDAQYAQSPQYISRLAHGSVAISF
jgi:tetratricopeptide (TPR) repeat protein